MPGITVEFVEGKLVDMQAQQRRFQAQADAALGACQALEMILGELTAAEQPKEDNTDDQA